MDSRGVSLETTIRGFPLHAMSRMRDDSARVAGESSTRSVAETKSACRAGEAKGRGAVSDAGMELSTR